MTAALALIGQVAALRLHRDLGLLVAAEDGGSAARYLLHKLKGREVAAIVAAILSDSQLASQVTLRIPRSLVEGEAVDPSVLTDENAAWARNAEVHTPILILASAADDLADTTRLLTPIGAPELKEQYDDWVEVASRDLGLPDPLPKVWVQALRGLRAADDVSLEQFAEYVALTLERIKLQSQPLLESLGWALPALQAPRHSAAFAGLKEKDQTSVDKWKRLFKQVYSPRRMQLRKQQASGRGALEVEALRAQFEKVMQDMTPEVQAIVEAFVAGQPGWNADAARLAALEWEQDRVLLLFENLKTKEDTNLARRTVHFFEMEHPEKLTEADRDYLKGLEKRSTTGSPRDDDVEFYETYRGDLKDVRQLKARWDRFIYGKGIECDDFIVGLLLAIEKLYEQAEEIRGRRTLTIRTHKRTPKDFLSLNADVLRFFSTRYRGLRDLTASTVRWDTKLLFELDELFSKAQKKKQYKPNYSLAKTAVQIKFDLELEVSSGVGATKKSATQLIWEGRPLALGMELRRDLARACKQPFAVSEVEARSVSKKGQLQTVSLDDAGTLEPAYDRDAGSLLGTVDSNRDLEKQWKAALSTAVAARRISEDGAASLTAAWSQFAADYRAALTAWSASGLAGDEPLAAARSYGMLLDKLAEHARGDLNRKELWQPVLKVGVAHVMGLQASAIVTPWHPLRMASSAIKLRSVAGLLEHFTKAQEVNFGDTRLFFSDLAQELRHPYYPEVVVGYEGERPVLLAVSETRNEYSLAEKPVQDGRQAETNDDPRDGADRIRDLMTRYLDLQPHEHANLSVALYNCDSTGLPLAAVSALTEFEEEGADEVRCNVILRHHDTTRLGRLYGQMLESVDADPDAVVASETSRNFMAKLRVGILLDPSTLPAGPTGKSVDIAFLQDVVSRRAQVEWLAVEADGTADFLHHVPSRWAYKRSAAEDELKSTAYLSCPRQPKVGWSYLAAVYAVIKSKDVAPGGRMLPARQIVFQDTSIHTLFREVHGLAEWVVNYDDLLDKRQLRNQGVNVIRYQRRRGQGRNLIVSSDSPLRVLRVLVKRRLGELDLGLADQELSALSTRMIEAASAISGDIVLRAAKQGVFAGELLGIVLSKALADEELGHSSSAAWFFLDDYAGWLGQREGRIADLLGLSAVEHDGRLSLRVIVTESKYVSAEGLSEERKRSQQQLSETVRRMQDALFGNPGRLDRDLWLARLGDLLLDGVGGALSDVQSLDMLRAGVRDGQVPIDLRGYSHVFVWGPAGVPSDHGQYPVPKLASCLQEVFSREQLRALLLAFHSGQSLVGVRERLGDDRPWQSFSYAVPAPPVRWAVAAGLAAESVAVASTANGNGAAQHLDGEEWNATGAGSTDVSPALTTEDDGPDEGSPPPDPAVATVPVPPVPSSPTAGGAYGPRLQSLVDSAVQVTSGEADVAWMRDVERTLRTALLGYNLSGNVLDGRLTPNSALIRLQGSHSLTVAQIEARRNELLTTHRLSILSVSARPGEIVVAVERPSREVVPLYEVLRRRKINRGPGGINASFVLGTRELDGELQYLNLWEPFAGQPQHAPHTLVAGTTGSGKSVLLQNLLLDICATNSPHLAQVYMIDPKMGVDYPAVKRLPHLQGGIITDQADAQVVLEQLLGEMDRRYALFAKHEAKNLQRFNAVVGPKARLPAVFLVHDEFAEWMMTPDYQKAVSGSVARLGVKARAAGIHLIFAAQRPDKDVFPMQLRANLGNRLVLRVADEATSMIALTAKGGERLLGRGHLVAKMDGEPDLVYVQVPYLSDDEFAAAAAALQGDANA